MKDRTPAGVPHPAAAADLPATALIQPASRVRYRFAVASLTANDAPVRRFVAWAEAHIDAQSLRGIGTREVEDVVPTPDRRRGAVRGCRTCSRRKRPWR